MPDTAVKTIDEARYPCITQRLRWLCIPAAIANLLAYLGDSEWDQERILGEWYLWRTGDRWLAGDWSGVEVRPDPNDGSVWERFLPTRIELDSPAKALAVSPLGSRFVFEFRKCTGGAGEALAVIEERLGRAEPLPSIASCSVPGGAHIVVVTGIDASTVRYHDPGEQSLSLADRDEFATSFGSEPQLLLVDRRT